MSIPQFGYPEPGRDYPDRPAAFVVIEDMGKIALVRVDLGDGRTRLDLPGGGIDPGETPAEAAARECGEEAGLKVTPLEVFERADHYFINPKGQSHNTRGIFFTGALDGEAPELKVEEDHELVWADPIEALVTLGRDSHAWAVAAWLRRVKA
jgi:8-oxo-dGTP diphosphatase